MELRKFRLKYDINQKDLAEKLHIKQTTYSNYENGKTQPPIELLIKIANLYHTSIDELVGRKQENIIDKGLLNEVELDIINKLKLLDKDNQIRLQAYTHALFDNQQQEIETIRRIKGER